MHVTVLFILLALKGGFIMKIMENRNALAAKRNSNSYALRINIRSVLNVNSSSKLFPAQVVIMQNIVKNASSILVMITIL